MTQRWNATVLGACMMALPACSDIEPCDGAVQGATYDVRMQTPSYAPEAACAAAWGFEDGTSFAAEVMGIKGDDTCKSGVIEVEEVAGWMLEPREASHGGGAMLHGVLTARRDDCVARLELTFSEQQLLVRAQQDSGACPTRCSFGAPATATRR